MLSNKAEENRKITPTIERYLLTKSETPRASVNFKGLNSSAPVAIHTGAMYLGESLTKSMSLVKSI